MLRLLVEGGHCSFYEAREQKLKTHTLINREFSLLDVCAHLLPLIALLRWGDNYLLEGPRPALGPVTSAPFLSPVDIEPADIISVDPYVYFRPCIRPLGLDAEYKT
jgi:hypothetical protein